MLTNQAVGWNTTVANALFRMYMLCFCEDVVRIRNTWGDSYIISYGRGPNEFIDIDSWTNSVGEMAIALELES